MTGEDTLSKAVSANITRILEDLLEDYDKTERPSYKEGQYFYLICYETFSIFVLKFAVVSKVESYTIAIHRYVRLSIV